MVAENKCQITGEPFKFMSDECALRYIRGTWIKGLFVPVSAIDKKSGYAVSEEEVVICNKVSFDRFSTESEMSTRRKK